MSDHMSGEHRGPVLAFRNVTKVYGEGDTEVRALNGVAPQTPSAAESAPNAATPTEAAP